MTVYSRPFDSDGLTIRRGYDAEAICEEVLGSIPDREKLIDFGCDGQHFFRLYFGDADLTDWGGDDWDNTPYEHNASNVYAEYCGGWLDFALPADAAVFEPCEGEFNSPWCKDDMKERRVPMLVLTGRIGAWSAFPYSFNEAAVAGDALRVFMGDNAKTVAREVAKRFGAICTDSAML